MIPYEFATPFRTERLVLRLLTPADQQDVLDWMSDPEVARYQLYEPRSPEQVAEHIEKVRKATTLAADDDFIELGIELPASEVDRARIIGCLYFKLARVDDLTAEIGWALTARYQGQGYAFEAASTVMDLGFGELGLHRITAQLDPRNSASVALCGRLGMRHEAHHVEDLMFKGAWADTGVYAILDREWAARS